MSTYESERIVTYGPNQRSHYSFIGSYVMMIKNLIYSRDLISQLFKRDFFAAYKKSFLGVGWVIISPIIGISSWIFMSMTGVLNPGNVGVPYPVYVLVGSSIWGLFMGFYTAGESTLSAGQGFILQVKYPHEALLLKQTAQHIANFIISFIINIIVILAFGIVPSWKIIFFPILVLPLFFLGAGVGLIMSVVTIVSVEVQKVFGIVLGLLIYTTPVIYSSKIDNPFLKKVLFWNPLTYLISVPREAMLTGNIENFRYYLISALGSLLVFIVSWRLFFISEEVVIEKMI